MTDELETSEQEPHAWPVPAIVLGVVFAALYGWFLYLAIVNLVEVPPAYEAYDLGDRIPWAILIGGIALPVVLFAGAAWFGVRRALTDRVLLFAAGLGATAATAFSLLEISRYLIAG